MSIIAGTWDLTVQSVVGDQLSVLELEDTGSGTFGGKTTDNNSGNVGNVANGKLDGNKFSYESALKLPIGEVTFVMEGTVGDDGKTLSGISRANFGDSPFTATKR